MMKDSALLINWIIHKDPTTSSCAAPWELTKHNFHVHQCATQSSDSLPGVFESVEKPYWEGVNYHNSPEAITAFLMADVLSGSLSVDVWCEGRTALSEWSV